MNRKWLPWFARAEAPEKDPLDAFVRSRLSAETPDGSFERVWAQVGRQIRDGERPTLPPWELMRTIDQLRLWVRSLAVGLAGAIAILAMVLWHSAHEPGEVSAFATATKDEGAPKGAFRRPEQLGDKGGYETPSFLNDPRIIYGPDTKELGG